MSEAEYDPHFRRKILSVTKGHSDAFSRAGGYHTELADHDNHEPNQEAKLEGREYLRAQAFEADCQSRVLRALGSLTTSEAKAGFVEQVEALAAQFQKEPDNNG